jgi:hypothetical protein
VLLATPLRSVNLSGSLFTGSNFNSETYSTVVDTP